MEFGNMTMKIDGMIRCLRMSILVMFPTENWFDHRDSIHSDCLISLDPGEKYDAKKRIVI